LEETILRSLIINADDFGLTTGVNEAIVDTFGVGCVTSTTLLVNAPATEDAVEKAKQHPGLGVGLHFNITLGRPISPADNVQTLVNAKGFFYPREVLARKLLLRRVDRSELELELDAQYQRMRSYQLRSTHIDSHQHVHAFPLCFDAVATLCQREGIPMRMPWVLNPNHVQVPPGRRLRQWVLQRMLSRNYELWSGLVRWNSGLGSIFDLGIGQQALDVAHYRSLLECAPEGIFELMVHPARAAAQLEGLTRIGDISEREWRFLMSNNLGALASDLGFTLANYKSL